MNKCLFLEPPPNGCVVTVGGQKYFKKIDEVWTTANPCVLESCAFNTNGDPEIKTKHETCNNICQPVSFNEVSIVIN